MPGEVSAPSAIRIMPSSLFPGGAYHPNQYRQREPRFTSSGFGRPAGSGFGRLAGSGAGKAAISGFGSGFGKASRCA
jgi:hypothetical protein